MRKVRAWELTSTAQPIRSLLPCIHVAEAVAATIAALDRGPSGSVYDVVDDRPVSMSDIVRATAERTGAHALDRAGLSATPVVPAPRVQRVFGQRYQQAAVRRWIVPWAERTAKQAPWEDDSAQISPPR